MLMCHLVGEQPEHDHAPGGLVALGNLTDPLTLWMALPVGLHLVAGLRSRTR